MQSLLHETQKGGDKLTLNLTGASNLTKATNTGQANTPTSPQSKASFPLPSASGHKSETPAVLLPLDLIQNTDDRTAAPNAVNGIGATSSAADTVTVTHFSETRGTMQKISVPSMNIFNAEFKASDANRSQLSSFLTPSSSSSSSAPPPLSSTNPFLNTSPVAVVATTKTHTTNPFHVSLNASPTTDQPDNTTIMPVQINNDSPKSNDIVSICSENNNGTIIATTLISKMDAKMKTMTTTTTTTPATATTNATKPIATNPFANAMDDIDNDNNYHSSGMNNSVVVVSDTKIRTNNNDALNNLKNNNCMVIERNNDSTMLDNEKNKTIKYIEVNSDILLLSFWLPFLLSVFSFFYRLFHFL